jgi:lipoate-protein ligase B
VRREHLLVPADMLGQRGAEVMETNRGGDITFHGPGQLVGYPILDLRRRDLGPTEYVRLLEATLIATLDRFGIEAWRSPGRPGVWTSGGKIAAIGVRIERGISMHGFALNIDIDLSWFEAIVPCGLAEASVTSMAAVLDRAPRPPIETVTEVLTDEFASTFAVRIEKPSRPPACSSSREARGASACALPR